MQTTVTSLRKMQGSALVVTAISLLAILAMAGLAIDTAHNIDNKARLQNSVDSAALAAAMYLLEEAQANVNAPSGNSITTAQANAAGLASHQSHLSANGSAWLTGAAPIEFCWSENLQDFSNCQTIMNLPVGADYNNTPFFVRARVLSTAIPNFIMQIVPGIPANRSVASTAVAGTTGTDLLCNVAPFFVCDNSPTMPADSNCDDGACWGHPVVTLGQATWTYNQFSNFNDLFYGIKIGSQDVPAANDNTAVGVNGSPTGITCSAGLALNPRDPQRGCAWVLDDATTPVVLNRTANQWKFNPNVTYNGNFFLLNLLDSDGNGQGASKTKDSIIYGHSCTSQGSMDTQPGNVSSIDSAFNALFGEPKNPYANDANIGNYADYIAKNSVVDWNPLSFGYYKRQYANASPAFDPNTSRYQKRMMSIPVLNCRNPDGSWKTINGNASVGTSDLPLEGTACFFLPRKMYQTNEKGTLLGNEAFIIAQHVHNKFCPPVYGTPGDTVNILKAQIILYEHYESTDS